MTDIVPLLDAQRILCRHNASSKKKTLEEMSELLAQTLPDDTGQSIFEALLKRERLGSTGLGQGIALPHGRIASLQKPIAAIATLENGIDFDALDGDPVTIVFALAMPEDCNDQHLQILAQVAAMFSDPMLCNSLRNAKSTDTILSVLAGWSRHAESA